MKEQTPEQIMKYGGVATALREWCERNNKTAKDINLIIGKDMGYSAGYIWLNGKGAPGPKTIKLLSKGTGIPEAQLMRRNTMNEVETIPAKINSNPPVFSFTVNDNGEARIKLDVTLPIQQAVPLFRMILDAGVIVNGQTPND